MAVAVQQPERKKRDIFDLVLGGLQAASAFTNIQKSQAELERIPEIQARQGRAEERQARAEEIKIAQTFEPTAEGTEGGISLPGREGLFLPRGTQAKQAERARKEQLETTKTARKDEGSLRNEWLKNPQTKTTQDVATAASKVAKVATGKPSAAGDLSLMFSYMKMLDPGSVVRETEQALATNAAGVPARIRTMYNNIRAGETLDKTQRKDFAEKAIQLYESHWEKQKAFNDAFSGLANRQGLNPQNVVLDLGLDPSEFNEIMSGYLQTAGNIGSGVGGILPKDREPERTVEDDVSDFRSLMGQ